MARQPEPRYVVQAAWVFFAAAWEVEGVRKRRATKGRREKSHERIVVECLDALARARRPLHREMRRIPPAERAGPDGKPHTCCVRERNEMRISTLEAESIARALHAWPELHARLDAIRARTREALAGLADIEQPQRYNCPLLDGERCLVHRVAKPIGCLAWNEGRDFSRAGWRAFLARDLLNERAYGEAWELKAIPLLLARHFDSNRPPLQEEAPARRSPNDASLSQSRGLPES